MSGLNYANYLNRMQHTKISNICNALAICNQCAFYPEYVHVNYNNVKKKREKTNTEGTSVVLLDLRQYYEKSSLAVFSYTC